MFTLLRLRLLPAVTSLSVALLCMLPASSVQAQVPPPPTLQELGEAQAPAVQAPAGPALQAPAIALDANNFDGIPDKPEALLRGPVHEAFAEPYTADPQPGLIIAKQPPEAIEELPPDARPDGENVEWIPGYWGWDEDRQDFVWVSGIWRVIPPNHRWVPGYWFQVDSGYQWVAGTWLRETAQEIEYLAKAPPTTLELGPVGNPPGDNYFWIPGCWTWGGTNYLWRPGYWSISYSNWVWVPSRYYWTPYGYAYCNGYWDYPFVDRGYLFAPYYFPNRSYLNVGFRFTPGISLSVGLLTNNFWVSARYGHYFFGDYYANYNRCGYQPWHHYHNSRRGYDPIFAYNQRHHHGNGNGRWNDRDGRSSYYQQVNNNFQRHVDHQDSRPPRTWSDQTARFGREDNNRRDGDQGGDNRRGPNGDRPDNALGQSWRDVVANKPQGEGPNSNRQSFTKLTDTERDQWRKNASSYRQLSETRRDTEANRDGGRGTWNKLPGGSGNGPTANNGNRNNNNIAGSTTTGIQNRFRLPQTDRTSKVRENSSQANGGPRMKLEPVTGTGDISSSIRRSQEAIDRAKNRFGNSASPSRSNNLGSSGTSTPGSGNSNPGVGSRAQAYQDAIDRARRERDSRGNTGSGSTSRSDGSPTGSSGSIRSQFDRSNTAQPKLDRSHFDGSSSNGSATGNSRIPGGFGTPGRTFTPRQNPSTSKPGASSNSQNDSVQSALERARRATSNPGTFTPNNSGAGTNRTITPTPGATRTFTPPGGTNRTITPTPGATRTFTPPGGTNRSFTPPSGNSGSSTSPFGRSRTSSPPTGGSTPSFTPPGSGSGSSNRGNFQPGSPRSSGGTSGSQFRRGSSYSPSSQPNATFRSRVPSSSSFGSSPGVSRSPVGGSRTFGGTSGGNSGSAARSFSPPSRSGSTPSFSRPDSSSSRSGFSSRGSTSGSSSDSSSSSRSRGRGRN